MPRGRASDWLRVPNELIDRDALRYAAPDAQFLPGHRVTILRDGQQAFPAMLAAIDRAEKEVAFETYIFEADPVGQRFIEALLAAARRGVATRLLVDGVGSFGLSETLLSKMRQGGVPVAVFRPVARVTPWRRLFQRNHRKLLIVDGVVAFTGGLNIGLEYAPTDEGGKGWRDTQVQVSGPVVAEFHRMFRRTWRMATGESPPRAPIDATEAVTSPRTELAAAVASARGRRFALRRRMLHAIARAQSTIYIASAYFIPDRRTRRALIRAATRGVSVELLLPQHSDIRSAQWAGEYLYTNLLRNGIKIYLWRKTHMHAKTVVVDGVWSSIGSANLDYVSLFNNLEVGVEIIGRLTGGNMTAMFEADRRAARELTATAWARRGVIKRFLQWLFFRFRRWL